MHKAIFFLFNLSIFPHILRSTCLLSLSLSRSPSCFHSIYIFSLLVFQSVCSASILSMTEKKIGQRMKTKNKSTMKSGMSMFLCLPMIRNTNFTIEHVNFLIYTITIRFVCQFAHLVYGFVWIWIYHLNACSLSSNGCWITMAAPKIEL